MPTLRMWILPGEDGRWQTNHKMPWVSEGMEVLCSYHRTNFLLDIFSSLIQDLCLPIICFLAYMLHDKLIQVSWFLIDKSYFWCWYHIAVKAHCLMITSQPYSTLSLSLSHYPLSCQSEKSSFCHASIASLQVFLCFRSPLFQAVGLLCSMITWYWSSWHALWKLTQLEMIQAKQWVRNILLPFSDIISGDRHSEDIIIF